MSKEKRPRKVYQVLAPIEPDISDFTSNKCSENARYINTHVESLEIDIWFDKHLFHRMQHGDDNGKREGIEFDLIKDLIINSVKHLFQYSGRVKNFHFINNGDEIGYDKKKIVLQRNIKDELMLNVVVECHYLNINKYEFTVKTAMRENNFHFSNGQYILELVGTNSTLFKKEGKKVEEISNIMT